MTHTRLIFPGSRIRAIASTLPGRKKFTGFFRHSPDGGNTWIPALTQSATRLSTKLKGFGVADYPIVSANGSDVYVVWTQAVNTSGVNVLQTFPLGEHELRCKFFSGKAIDDGQFD